MRIDQIVILGASGHGGVVFDALLQMGVDKGNITVIDDSTHLHGKSFFGLTIVGPSPIGTRWFHVAIGNCATRSRKYTELKVLGGRPFTVVHPKVVVSPFAVIGGGTFIAAGAVVGPGAIIGDGVILNHGSVVDHDCIVGHHSHIAPRATLGGGVHIGSGVFIGAGAVVLPGVVVGEAAVVGAGAVVLRDIPAGSTYVGVPAAEIARGLSD